MDIKTLKIQYLEHLEIEKNRSQKTLENYGRYLNRFFAFANVSNPGQIDDELVRKYRLHLNRLVDTDGNSLKKVTQNYHIIALRNSLNWKSWTDCLTPRKAPAWTLFETEHCLPPCSVPVCVYRSCALWTETR